MGDIILRDFDGNTLSTFWQYGLIDWEMFYSCLHTIILSPNGWAVFRYDENAPEGHGAFYPPSHDFPEPGTYILLRPDGGQISVGLTPISAHPTISNTPARTDHYRTRVHHRDPCCLVSGLVAQDNHCRFKAAHIYPRAHDNEWIRKGYSSRITDPAPLAALGGSTKIDSIQNVILLRGDLYNGWASYDFAVNPDRGYAVIPFVPGYDDIAGNFLKLDHISDSNLRPLDDLFRDHFLQGVLKNMKGTGEPNWDYEEALSSMDLSRLDIWGGKRGQEHLEFEIAHRLHSLQAAQESS